jgi:signal peptidase I
MLSDDVDNHDYSAAMRDSRALRAKAARRSWLCPGAGFALLGQGGLAVATFLTSLGTLLALIWLVVWPGLTVLWVIIGGLCLSTGLWLAEQIAVRRSHPAAPQPVFLVHGYVLAATASWLTGGVALVLILTRFGSLVMLGGGMAPTLERGERLLYDRWLEPEQPRRGAVILYKNSEQSAWGQPGTLIVSRIIAVPGDRLSVRDGSYLVNGEPGPPVAATDPFAPALDVPRAPAVLNVPEACFFVVQDSPQKGYDSRVLSWVKAGEVASTRLYYLSDRGFLKPVE